MFYLLDEDFTPNFAARTTQINHFGVRDPLKYIISGEIAFCLSRLGD